MAYAMPRHVRRSAERGFSSHAVSSVRMYSASLAGETVLGSRQGTGGRRKGADWTSSTGILLCRYRPGLELELGITELPHFRQVEAFEFRLGGHAVADDRVDNQVHDETEREDETNERGHAEKLRHQLAGIAVEQAGGAAS